MRPSENPPKPCITLEKKNKLDEEYYSNKQLKVVLSAYLKDKSKNEMILLQKGKDLAEANARYEHEKARLIYILLGSISVFLSGLATIYYIFYQQKQKTTNQLTEVNNLLHNEQKRLQSSNKKLRHFGRVISHDVLSNLNLILSTGNVLVGKQRNKDRLVQYYDMTQRTSQMLRDYCLRLLEESLKIKEGSASAILDPMPVLQVVLDHFKPALQAHNFRVEVADLSPACLPAVLVEQMFQNLISNAIHHGSTAPEPLLRVVEDTDEQGHVLWVVEDNGPGVAPEQRDAIWQGATAPTQADTGQGLGLSLTRATLREYGADIWVEERQGGGTRFIVQFI